MDFFQLQRGEYTVLSLRVDGKCGLVLDGNDGKWPKMLKKWEKWKEMLKNGPSSWEAFSVLNLLINCYS